VPRPVALLDVIKHPDVHNVTADSPEGMVPSGVYVMTEDGWHPLFIEKKRITS
jgi:hypothetical protein